MQDVLHNELCYVLEDLVHVAQGVVVLGARRKFQSMKCVYVGA